MSIDHYPRKSPFEISELAAFDKDIEFDPEDEQRRKRLAYLSQAMTQVGYGKSLFKAMGCVLVPFIIIPLFWPILLFAYFMRKRMMRMLDEQVDDALRYWDIDRYDLEQYERY